MKEAGVGGSLLAITNAIGDFAKQLDGTIESIAGTKSAIDTRLYGSKSKTGGGFTGNVGSSH